MLTRLAKKLEYWFSERGFPKFVYVTAISFLFFLISTTIHELGHFISASLLGCEAGIRYVSLFTGSTGLGECHPHVLSIIALSGPLFAFAVGLLIWEYDENSPWRVLALIMFFLSSILQLIPKEPLDMGKAIAWGLNPIVGWIIFLTVFAISFNLLWLEITEEEDKIIR